MKTGRQLPSKDCHIHKPSAQQLNVALYQAPTIEQSCANALSN